MSRKKLDAAVLDLADGFFARANDDYAAGNVNAAEWNAEIGRSLDEAAAFIAAGTRPHYSPKGHDQ